MRPFALLTAVTLCLIVLAFAPAGQQPRADGAAYLPAVVLPPLSPQVMLPADPRRSLAPACGDPACDCGCNDGADCGCAAKKTLRTTARYGQPTFEGQGKGAVKQSTVRRSSPVRSAVIRAPFPSFQPMPFFGGGMPMTGGFGGGGACRGGG